MTTNYVALWWRSLLKADTARRVVLDGERPRGFTLFLLGLVIAGYGAYGSTMGMYAGSVPATVSAIKFPLLYLLSGLVCLIPLYAMTALADLRINFSACVTMLLLLMSANAVAISSYAPISAFYGLTTSNNGYAFMVLMHVFVLGCAGAASLTVNLTVVRAASLKSQHGIHAGLIGGFLVLYAVVGTHMAWTLRPWIAKPSLDYEPLRPIGGSFPEAVWQHLQSLFLN